MTMPSGLRGFVLAAQVATTVGWLGATDLGQSVPNPVL
jgi:hypothetical protein